MPVYDLLCTRDKLLAVYPGAGHNFPHEARKAAYEFVDKVLRR